MYPYAPENTPAAWETHDDNPAVTLNPCFRWYPFSEIHSTATTVTGFGSHSLPIVLT